MRTGTRRGIEPPNTPNTPKKTALFGVFGVFGGKSLEKSSCWLEKTEERVGTSSNEDSL